MDIICYIIPLSDLTDWVGIGIDVLIGGVLAYVLASVVPKKMNDKRNLKDYYIEEMKSVKVEFNDLCKQISLQQIEANVIRKTFKQLSIRLSDIQYSVNINLKIHIDVLRDLTSTQTFLTNTEEMNNQFNSRTIKLNSSTERKLIEKQEIFNRNMLSAIAGINAAN